MTVFTVIAFVQTPLLMLWAGLIAGSFVRALSGDALDTQPSVGRNSNPCPGLKRSARLLTGRHLS